MSPSRSGPVSRAGVGSLAQRLRAARTAAGLSQTALAGEDFSPSYVSYIEAGRRVPTDEALAVLAARLGTTAEYLREGDDAPSLTRVRLTVDYAKLALSGGDPAQARNRLLELAVPDDHLPSSLRVEIALTLARAQEELGSLEEAVDILEPLLTELRRTGRMLDAARVCTTLVASYLESGDLQRGVEIGGQVLAEIEDAGLRGTDEYLRLAATVLWTYCERGDLLYATHWAAELTSIAEEASTPRGRGSIYWNAALVAESRGDLELALRLTHRALDLLGADAAGRDLPRLQLHYGWLLLREQDPDPTAALEQLREAAVGLEADGASIDLARCEVEQARAHLLLRDPLAAARLAESALSRLGDEPRIEACDAQIVLGDARYAVGDREGGARRYRWAAEMLGMMTAGRLSAGAWRALGDRFAAAGDAAGAVHAFDRALREVGVQPASMVGLIRAAEPEEDGVRAAGETA